MALQFFGRKSGEQVLARRRSRTKEPCNFHSMLHSIWGKSAIRMITKEPGALDGLPQGSANFTALLIDKILR